jgi:hypothetical protein
VEGHLGHLVLTTLQLHFDMKLAFVGAGSMGAQIARSMHHKPCHRCVTHSRNQEDTEGHRRTRRLLKLSTGGHWRNRRDTGGYDVRRVRDREAPGSNPGPPTSSEFRSVDGAFQRPAGHAIVL